MMQVFALLFRFSNVLKYLPPNINNCRNLPTVFMISFLLNFSPQLNLPVKKGLLTGFSCLPLRSYGFALHKSAFRDGLLLHYHWTSLACPTSCACGHDFTIDHCVSCPKGGFPSLQHNEVCDLTAQMSEVCNNVSIEPHLQPLSGEALRFKTANSDSNAQLDIAANGFWGGRFEHSFFDVRVFNHGAPSNHPFKSACCCHEREKRCQYEQHVCEVEHGHFTLLVFYYYRGMGDAAGQVYKRLANLLTKKFVLMGR